MKRVYFFSLPFAFIFQLNAMILQPLKIDSVQNSYENRLGIPDNVEFSVTIIGSGNPQYNPDRSQPSALVQYKGVKFLVDMGNGTKAQLEKLSLTGRNSPDALFITHHHIDHNDEFISIVHSKLMMGNEFLVAGPTPIDEMTNYAAKFYKEDLNYRLRNSGRTIDENNINTKISVLKGGENFEYKGVKISTIEVPHIIRTIAYRFDADGKSIVITGDLSYTNNLQKLAKDVDILVIDGKTASNRNGTGTTNQRSQNERQHNSDNESVKAHASIDEIAKMATECSAKIMVLTHLGSQPVDEEATSKRYADLGFKGKVVVAADFLTVTPEGECFMLLEKSFSNAPLGENIQNTSARNSQNRNLMERFDTNGDKKISQAEAKGQLKDNFTKLDTNGDGYVSTEEIRNGWQGR